MGCNCGGSRVAYAVIRKDGSQAPGSPFDSSIQARKVALSSGGKVKPVPKTTNAMGQRISGPRA